MSDTDTTTTAADDTFEYTARADERLPDDFHEWPESYRKASDAGIAQLLANHPGATVISDTSECIDDTNPRFPDDAEHKGKFWLIRTVKLDLPAAGSSEPMTAAGRLRAFEDEHFGDAVRINEMIERGSGSPYAMAAPEIRNQHVALTNLIAAEQKVDDAKGALAQAEADYAVAEKACDAAPE